MDKKNILVVGPTVDFGGREIMTNLLYHSLNEQYNVTVLSTVFMSEKSVALKNVPKSNWDIISYALYRKHPFLKYTAQLTKSLFKRKEPAYYFINNKLSKWFFNFEKLNIKVIHQFIQKNDLVIYSDEITGNRLPDFMTICEELNATLLTVITGQIKKIPSYLINSEKQLNFLSHSKINTSLISEQISQSKVWNIDQTSAIESDLLQLKLKEHKPLIYGYLGRFSHEKGVKELLDVCTENGAQLLLAGDGPDLHLVNKACGTNENINCVGKLKPSELNDFYNKIDVLVIPSFEEGGPIVGVEAMAAGKLIISTKVGAMPERMLGTDNNFWFNHDIPNSLNEAIQKVEMLNPEERFKIKEQLRLKYQKHHSIKSIKSQYIALVDQLVTNA